MRILAPLPTLLSLLGLPAVGLAQNPETPRASPAARVTQTVGLTEVEVAYSSPGVKGRKIWNDLVMYGKVWRTGANAATTISFSNAVKFGGVDVKPGKYALFTIPGPKSWTIILSSKTDVWGASDYDKKYDVARIRAKPQKAPHRERMTFLFSDTTDDATRLDLEWAETRVSIPLKVDTKKQVMANIDAALSSAWRPHYTSARYLLENGGDMKKALTWIDQSIAVQKTWSNHWVKAQILQKLGRTSDALETARQAKKLGAGERVYEGFYKERIDEALQRWKKAS